MKKILILVALVAVIVAVALVVWYQSASDTQPTATATPSMSVSSTPSSSPTPTSSFRSIRPDITAPASCEVGGRIVFTKPNLYRSENAHISYKNIDSSGRLIKWLVSPNDALTVGPNIFANLKIPSGTEAITVSLPSRPSARQYALTAAVTYGEIDQNDNVVVKTARCRGSIGVTLSY